MEPSVKPLEELRKAQAAIDGMKTATNVAQFEAQWKAFLHHLERVWSKAAAHYGQRPQWKLWKGPFESLRRSDPLLSYLLNARGADEHTVSDIVQVEPGGLEIGAATGNSLYVERMEINRGHITVKSPQAIRVHFTPARMTLLPIMNRGRSYPVPDTHLGATIQSKDAVAIATSGASFYASFLKQAGEFFAE